MQNQTEHQLKEAATATTKIEVVFQENFNQ